MKQPNDRFWVRAELVEPNPPGTWPTALVRIFDGDRQIGTYLRNMASWSDETFEPFQWDGEWFALYAPDYTSTRVMALPTCRDLGGEEPASDGFCPVEFLAPRYREVSTIDSASGRRDTYWQFSSDDAGGLDASDDREIGPWMSIPTGFVAGCRWGDDATWKLECIDLAMAARGRIVRTARFGHVELAHGHPLAASLRFDHFPPYWDLRMTLVRQERRDVATGAIIDPYDE